MRGQASDIEIQAAEILRVKNILKQILSFHTGKSEEVVAELTERDFYLSAQQAKNFGLIDSIMEKRPI